MKDDTQSPLTDRTSKTAASDITLHQLRVFWAIANADSLTKAAKELGLAQPSLSQQLSKLEGTIGLRLFERRASHMELTDAGEYLLPRASAIMRDMADIEDGLAAIRGGTRATIRISGVSSVLSSIIPQAIAKTSATYPDLHVDIQDNAPNDVLDLLYARKINIGLVSSNAIAEASVGFLQVPIIEDSYVLATPDSLDLSNISSLAELDSASAAVMNRAIQFNFGSAHTNRIANWYDQHLPDHQVIAQCRSFDMALEMVRAHLGICLVPSLSTIVSGKLMSGIKIYAVNEPTRKIVALIASQNRRQQPFSDFLDNLQGIGENIVIPKPLPIPKLFT